VGQGWDATHIPSYGPESRGGTSYADVRIAEREVLSPACPSPHVLVAFNGPSLAKFGPAVTPGGVVVYDAGLAGAPQGLAAGVRAVGVRCAEMAAALGRPQVKNAVALGALLEAVPLIPVDVLAAALREALAGKADLVAVNEEALRLGAQAARG
jgi:Pyruvate/2-oxoacid:ferredoxin oxidoreductase gamma subunit